MSRTLYIVIVVSFLFGLSFALKREHEFLDLVGHSIQEFEEIALARGAGLVRIVEVDGVSRYLTKDLRADRINVKVKTVEGNHVVTEIAGFF